MSIPGISEMESVMGWASLSDHQNRRMKEDGVMADAMAQEKYITTWKRQFTIRYGS